MSYIYGTSYGATYHGVVTDAEEAHHLGTSYGATYHGVVTDAEEAHHLYVRGTKEVSELDELHVIYNQFLLAKRIETKSCIFQGHIAYF